jgi:hypothetical protein
VSGREMVILGLHETLLLLLLLRYYIHVTEGVSSAPARRGHAAGGGPGSEKGGWTALPPAPGHLSLSLLSLSPLLLPPLLFRSPYAMRSAAARAPAAAATPPITVAAAPLVVDVEGRREGTAAGRGVAWDAAGVGAACWTGPHVIEKDCAWPGATASPAAALLMHAPGPGMKTLTHPAEHDVPLQ